MHSFVHIFANYRPIFKFLHCYTATLSSTFAASSREKFGKSVHVFFDSQFSHYCSVFVIKFLEFCNTRKTNAVILFCLHDTVLQNSISTSDSCAEANNNNL